MSLGAWAKHRRARAGWRSPRRSWTAALVLLGVVGSVVVLVTPLAGISSGATRAPVANSPLPPGTPSAPAAFAGPAAVESPGNSSNGTGVPAPGVWTSVTTYVVPPARAFASMAYDNVSGYDVLFGGENGPNSPLGDTWTFQEDLWQEVTTANGPSPRFGATMVYDPSLGAGAVLLFGGTNGTTFFNDTWEFVGGTWVELHPASAPPARAYGAGMYDPVTSQVVLFGGLGTDGDLNDTWAYSNGDWVNVSTAIAPAARDEAGFAYDAADGYGVLFGGEDLTQEFSDTWTYANGVWSNATASAGDSPSARRAYGNMAPAGSSDAGVLLFGGENYYSGGFYNDTWTFEDGHWSLATPEFAPSGRWAPTLVWDSSLGGDLLVDGIANGTAAQRDSYLWNGTAWAATPEATIPQPRYDPALAYDPAIQGDVLFGGLGTQSSLENTDTWTFVNRTWSVVKFSPDALLPGERWGASMAYDPLDDELVLFGGYDNQTRQPYPDTWTYQNGVWSELPPGESPPARYGASMVWDSEANSILLFGGFGQNDVLLNDTWYFSGEGWSPASTPTAPSPRAFAAMSDDPSSNEVVLFGGCDDVTVALGCTRALQDTWSFTDGGWTERFPASAPPPRAYGAMAYDSLGGYAVLYGGWNPYQVFSDTWEFSDGSWFNITGAQSPGELQAFGFTYDESAQEFVLMGGLEGFVGAPISGMTWELVGGPPLKPPVAHNFDYWLFSDQPPLGIALISTSGASYIAVFGAIGTVSYVVIRWNSLRSGRGTK